MIPFLLGSFAKHDAIIYEKNVANAYATLFNCQTFYLSPSFGTSD